MPAPIQPGSSARPSAPGSVSAAEPGSVSSVVAAVPKSLPPPEPIAAEVHPEPHPVSRHSDDDHLTAAFFSTSHGSEHVADGWEEGLLPSMTHGSRRAMYATLGIFGVSVLVLGGYVAYQRLVMPVPAELGHGSGLPASVAVAATSRAALSESPSPPPAAPTAVPAAPANAAQPVAPQPEVQPPVAAALPQPTATAPTASGPEVLARLDNAPNAAPPTALEAPPAAEPSAQPAAALAPAAGAAPPTDAPQAAPRVATVAPGLAEADALYAHGQRRAALQAYEHVLADYPNDAAALSRVAYIHLDAGHNKRASEFAARAVELDAQSSEGWIVLAAAREALGDRKGAREAYRNCAAGTGAYVAECKRLGR